MNFICESKILFNTNVRLLALLTMPMGENRFSIHDARSLTNISIVSVYGDYRYIVEIANFNIYNTYWKLTD